MDQALAGHLLINPPDGMREAVRKDYAAMAGMIVGDAPKFEWVMEQVEAVADQLESFKQSDGKTTQAAG